MPTEWEQDVAEIYVNYRSISRPNIINIFIPFFVFLVATCLFTLLIHCVLMTVGIFEYLPSRVQGIYNLHPFLSIVILFAIVIFIGMLFCFKYAVIGVIKLYQYYAPEEIRRRCLFMPTCSEYAIMAIRKFGSVIGLYKSYYRLFYRCRGNIYMIDYP